MVAFQRGWPADDSAMSLDVLSDETLDAT